MARTEAEKLRIPCAMSGLRAVLTVKPTGRGGVSFIYGDDASVIVDGENLVKIRAILDAQISGGKALEKERGAGRG